MGKVTGLRWPKRMQRYSVEIEAPLCERCHYILEVEAHLSELHTKRPDYFLNRGERSIWRWREFLPIEKEEVIVSLDEGGTPLVPVEGLPRDA